MTLLREWIKCPSMSALINNIAASQLHLLVYKIVLSYMIRPAVSSPSSRTVLYTRQLLHMIMGSSVLFWSLYDTKDWSWRLNVLVPLVVAARLFYKVREYLVMFFECEYNQIAHAVAFSQLFTPLSHITPCFRAILWHPMKISKSNLSLAVHLHRNYCLVLFNSP